MPYLIMDINQLIKLANYFYILAAKLPPKSTDLKSILKTIDSLDTYKDRIDYAEKCLKHLSSGSSRIVYLSPDNTVIKLAKNDKGIDQNKAESNPKMKSDYLNITLNKSKKHFWIEVPFLEKITEKEFEELTDINFKDFSNSIKYELQDVAGNSKDKPSSLNEVKKSKIFKEFKRLGEQFKLMPGDIARISSWGKYKNYPVLIDAGLTKKIFDKHYES